MKAFDDVASDELKNFFLECWENSSKDKIAVAYLFGTIDTLLWTGDLTTEGHACILKAFCEEVGIDIERFTEAKKS